jgi:hypothetical protein
MVKKVAKHPLILSLTISNLCSGECYNILVCRRWLSAKHQKLPVLEIRDVVFHNKFSFIFQIVGFTVCVIVQ